MKIKYLIALMLTITAKAFADDPFPLPCDDCTNNVPYTNAPVASTSYAPTNLIVRIVSITMPSAGVIWTNAGWLTNGDGTIFPAPGDFTGVPVDIHLFNTWLFKLGILNTSSNNQYNVLGTLALESGFTELGKFVGAVNGSECFVDVTGGAKVNGFFKVGVFTDRFVVWTRPGAAGPGSGSGCPGAYNGYGNYIKAAPVWGWFQDTNAPAWSAQDGTGRIDTKIQWVTEFGEAGCDASGFVAIPKFWQPAGFPPPAARFTIYFNGNVVTNAYPLILSGFLR